MVKTTVFESTNMGSTHFAERCFDCVADTDIENGTFGYMDGFATGYDHIYKFKKGLKDGEKVVVVDQPAWTEDESRLSNQRRDKFIIPANTPFRVRVLKVGDEFGITIEGISGDTRSVVTSATDFATTNVYLTVGNTAASGSSAGNAGKLVAATSKATSPAMEARIERKRKVGGTLLTGIRTYGYANDMYEARVTVLK